MKFVKDQEIVLLPFEDEPREEAIYVKKSGPDCHIVLVKNPSDPYDDGLREVTTDQIEQTS